ncbi:hypothetical protein BDV98DRAFT_641096 [Pterulicium gracile]|uniref:Uncharacterized protein n=1 Tax=Pterulicium gracile TaxID=1884261 RepID=A0A5C3Q3H6_9AGAR|nr:hypothetical protein BDV98DRAFT_641096 [Pterula gracilis]
MPWSSYRRRLSIGSPTPTLSPLDIRAGFLRLCPSTHLANRDIQQYFRRREAGVERFCGVRRLGKRDCAGSGVDIGRFMRDVRGVASVDDGVQAAIVVGDSAHKALHQLRVDNLRCGEVRIDWHVFVVPALNFAQGDEGEHESGAGVSAVEISSRVGV